MEYTFFDKEAVGAGLELYRLILEQMLKTIENIYNEEA